MTQMCRLYGVTRTGYYAWRRRGLSARRRHDQALLAPIQAIFTQSRGIFAFGLRDLWDASSEETRTAIRWKLGAT